MNNNGFIVICASNEGGICQYTDDVADLDGGNTVTIEACSNADGTGCKIIDVFGIPGKKDDDAKDQDFTDGRAYRLEGPVHDTPKGIWDRDDWVILKPLDGEDTTPGDRDDFNLIITEVTDTDNFIELHSTNVHNNYPFPDVSRMFVLICLCLLFIERYMFWLSSYDVYSLTYLLLFSVFCWYFAELFCCQVYRRKLVFTNTNCVPFEG